MSKKLTPIQIRAAEMLAHGEKQHGIAFILSVSDNTVSRWKKQKAFNALIEKTLADKRAVVLSKINGLAEAAALALYEELKSDQNSKRVEVAFRLMDILGVERILGPALPASKPELLTLENEARPPLTLSLEKP